MKCPECNHDIPMPEWLVEALDELARYKTVEALMNGDEPMRLAKE